MTTYSVVHIALAILSAFLAALHLALWLNVRADRVQLWVAISFLGFAILDVGIAGGSLAAHGGMGRAAMWVFLGSVANIPLFPSTFRMAELMAGKEAGRRWLLQGLLTVGIVRTADLFVTGLRLMHAGHELNWEMLANSLAAPTTLPIWGIAFISGAIANAEALEDVGRRSATGLIMLISSIPATLLTFREIMLTFGYMQGPTLIGLIGLPFLITTSALVGLRYRRALAATMMDTDEREISGYTIERRLGRGGMGELFLATRMGAGGFARKVALKRIRREVIGDPAIMERFFAEARLAGMLRHPNIVAVQDVGSIGGDWFMAMEYLPGVTLDEMRERARETGRAVPIPFVVAVGEGMAKGLACAHAAGVVHRDVKPSNVMITFEGEVKVIDFGIAFELKRDGERVTSAGKIVGTGPYLPPERMQGLPGEPPGDVFALGTVLYEALTGIRPYAGRTPQELLHSIRSRAFLPLADMRPEVPAALATLVEKAISADGMSRPTAELIGETLAALRTRLPDAALAATVRAFCPEIWREERRVELFAARHRREPETATTAASVRRF